MIRYDPNDPDVMTDAEKRGLVLRVVAASAAHHVSDILQQLMGIFPETGDVVRKIQERVTVFFDHPEKVLEYTEEPRRWYQMALYGAGLADANPVDVSDTCDTLVEWLFTPPEHNFPHIPPQWADSYIGVLWWAAKIRLEHDELITIDAAARLAGVSVRAIRQRTEHGTLTLYLDPFYTGHGDSRRLVRRSDIVE